MPPLLDSRTATGRPVGPNPGPRSRRRRPPLRPVAVRRRPKATAAPADLGFEVLVFEVLVGAAWGLVAAGLLSASTGVGPFPAVVVGLILFFLLDEEGPFRDPKPPVRRRRPLFGRRRTAGPAPARPRPPPDSFTAS